MYGGAASGHSQGNVEQREAVRPWISDMPQLVARLSVADGAEDWAARGPRGAELIARRLPVAEANQPTLVDRLRWVHQAGSPDLSPLVGAVVRPDGVWALYQRVPAVPLPRLLETGPLSQIGRAHV